MNNRTNSPLPLEETSFTIEAPKEETRNVDDLFKTVRERQRYQSGLADHAKDANGSVVDDEKASHWLDRRVRSLLSR
jgi:predicted transcriptional regulator